MKGRRLFVLALIVVSGLALALLSVFLFAVQIVASDRQRTTSFRGTRTIEVAKLKGDDYCDSPGPRRPGEIDKEEMLSSACSFWLPGIRLFSCKDSGSGKIFLSRIGDGVCDCSSCEDEASVSLAITLPRKPRNNDWI
jgi:hypothetical protein